MENFEAVETTSGETETENKKNTNSKAGDVLDVIWLCIFLIIFGFWIYLDKTGSEPFLFGRVWNIRILFTFLLLANAINKFFLLKKRSADRKTIITYGVLITLIACSFLYDVYSDIKNTTDTEQITLSDGNEIIFKEYIRKKEYTYIDVYHVNGIIAKKLGYIDEIFFYNQCLLQDKYSYEYDEAGKKLTVICEHGSASLEEQYGTGFWEREFTLE